MNETYQAVVADQSIELERRMMEAGVSMSIVALSQPQPLWNVRLHRSKGATGEVEVVGVVQGQAPTLSTAFWLACEKAGLTEGLVPPDPGRVPEPPAVGGVPDMVQATREILIQVIEALGGTASPTASWAFLAHVPEEVRLFRRRHEENAHQARRVAEGLSARLLEAEALIASQHEALASAYRRAEEAEAELARLKDLFSPPAPAPPDAPANAKRLAAFVKKSLSRDLDPFVNEQVSERTRAWKPPKGWKP